MLGNLRFLVLLLWCGFASAQEGRQAYGFDANYFYGNLIEHSKNVSHLITGHPTGFVLSYNQRTFGEQHWESRYNYPDWGFSYAQTDFPNEVLGTNYGIYSHMNFYFLNRKLMFRIGPGIVIAGNPYDIDDNYRNNAFGSRILGGMLFMANYKQPNIFKNFGIQAGLTGLHYSNGSAKSPNVSLNVITVNMGINYQLDDDESPAYVSHMTEDYSEPIKFNVVIRGGVNESDYIGMGQKPFFVFSSFIDKKINRMSSFQAGADFFLSTFLKDEIKYLSIAFPQYNVKGDEDWKRVGLFLGHELRFNHNALITQAGYYVYSPYKYYSDIYLRMGIKRYFTERYYGVITLKTHWGDAEAFELGIGMRL